MTADTVARTYKHNYAYYLLKYLSHFVRPGARRVDTFTLTGHENLLGRMRSRAGITGKSRVVADESREGRPPSRPIYHFRPQNEEKKGTARISSLPKIVEAAPTATLRSLDLADLRHGLAREFIPDSPESRIQGSPGRGQRPCKSELHGVKYRAMGCFTRHLQHLVGASSQDTRLKGQFKLECELTCKP